MLRSSPVSPALRHRTSLSSGICIISLQFMASAPPFLQISAGYIIRIIRICTQVICNVFCPDVGSARTPREWTRGDARFLKAITACRLPVLSTVCMQLSLVGFYLAIMNSMFDGALFIRILSYVPFISAILSPSLLVTGVIGFKDILLSILLMVVVIYLLLKYGLKIYKEGILNYSSTKLWKKMLEALKH